MLLKRFTSRQNKIADRDMKIFEKQDIEKNI